MWATDRGASFTVIGENIHATRVVLRSGRFGTTAPDGRAAVRFTDERGQAALLPVPASMLAEQDFANGRIKQVKAAILQAIGGSGPDAEVGLAFLRALALRQQAAGADYLDLNVDEVAADEPSQQAAMRWLVRMVEAVASVPVALDSSSAGVIVAGLEASQRPHGAPLLNSASLERLEVLDLAAQEDCPVVVNAAGRGGMPADAAERVANVREALGAGSARGLALSSCFVDALVLPVGVEPEAGAHFLAALRGLRDEYGGAVHLTGGLSNVSFGLPNRRLLNEVFVALAVECGADAGILDPLATDPRSCSGGDRTGRAWKLAEDVLTGRDAYGADYLAAFRAGELERGVV